MEKEDWLEKEDSGGREEDEEEEGEGGEWKRAPACTWRSSWVAAPVEVL